MNFPTIEQLMANYPRLQPALCNTMITEYSEKMVDHVVEANKQRLVAICWRVEALGSTVSRCLTTEVNDSHTQLSVQTKQTIIEEAMTEFLRQKEVEMDVPAAATALAQPTADLHTTPPPSGVLVDQHG